MVAAKIENPLTQLERYGQSVWLDNFRRGWLVSGELGRMIREDGILGVTINPTIFEKAVSGSADYDDAIRDLVTQGKDTKQIYEELMIQDIRMAADLFRPVYDRTLGADGFVSIELPPSMAYDTAATIAEARRYHKLVDRENILIKVPGTAQGVPAIEKLISEGINVNVTLLFSIESYEQVARAYIRGLAHRLNSGKLVNQVASVASFFVSRIDVAVDRKLEALISEAGDQKRSELESLKGKAAIANAKLAYQRFKEIFSEPEFKALELRGARAQRVLWASTGTKNPHYSDVYYVESLIGPQTVDTMPTQTLFSFKNHGKVFPSLEEGLENAKNVMNRLKSVGVDFNTITQKLEEEGVNSFQKSVDNLMSCVETKHKSIHGIQEGRQTLRLGNYSARIDFALAALTEQAFSRRLWERDTSLWKQGPDGDKVINNRLGWLDIVQTMIEREADISQFAEDVKAAGFTHAVLMGMGGSSLSPEVSRQTYGVRPGYPQLMVLDSTVPAAVAEIEREIDPTKTLFIVSTKSGGTVETLSAYKHFFELVQKAKGDQAGENFVAITDPGSSLQKEASNKTFRRTFINFQDIGGRYSALSYFGMVPAAIIGVDINTLLHRAWEMMESSASCIAPTENPGIILGTVMGELAMEGRNKLTLILSPEISSFGLWVEQLVAESTGKNGQGVVPIDGEAIQSPAHYGDDRLFVYMKLNTTVDMELDAKVHAIERSGQPVVRILLEDIYDLGQEYYRWEIATAVASAVMGVNAFDELNVTESKENTVALLNVFKETGALPEISPVLEEDGIKLFCDDQTKSVLDKIRSTGPYADDSLLSYVAAYLDEFQPGNYFALIAFIKQTKEIDQAFSGIRTCLMEAFSASSTLGFGPRFLHSTGQLHKGGPNMGLFIQFTADDSEDVVIPGEPYTFSILKQAQEMGDGKSLRSKGRPMIRLHLGKDVESGLNRVLDLVREATKEQIAEQQ